VTDAELDLLRRLVGDHLARAEPSDHVTRERRRSRIEHACVLGTLEDLEEAELLVLRVAIDELPVDAVPYFLGRLRWLVGEILQARSFD
jgi:hypothetical protein